MELLTPEPGFILWTVLCLLHIVLGWIGARRMVKLDIDPFIKFLWLVAIFIIPFAGIATFIVMRNNKRELS